MKRCAAVAGLLATMWLCSTAVAGSQAGAARVGPAPAPQQLNLVLPLRVDGPGLQRWANEVNDPASPRYGQYESISALAARFGASAAVRGRVISFLRAAGATGVKIDATGLFADATMSAGLAERLFGTSLSQFRTAHQGRYVAPTTTVNLPAALRGIATGVLGLDTRPLFKAPALARMPRGHRRTGHAASIPSSAYFTAPAGPRFGCAGAINTKAFTPNQYLKAYGFGTMYAAGFTGRGERVALIEIDGFHIADIRTFQHCFGLGGPAINVFGVGVNHPLPAGGETTLDLEVMATAAPGLSSIDVYESPPDVARSLQAMTAPLQNPGHKPQVISASLGQCERAVVDDIGKPGINAVQNSLAIAAASGVSFLAASGDSGAADCPGPHALPLHFRAVNYPASSAFAVSVGGTQLHTTAANTISRQLVWNDAGDAPASAGGGGFSDGFRRPSYQNGVVNNRFRAVPDVSMLADIAPGYAVYCTASDCLRGGGPAWQAVGGTSAATPLLGAGFALIDQDLRAHRRQNIGWANPLLYKLGRSSLRSSVFSDVLQYSNDVGPFFGNRRPLGCCAARAGFDEASGWGSVDIGNLDQVALRLQPSLIGLSIPAHQRPVRSHKLRAAISCALACNVVAATVVRIRGRFAFQITSRQHSLRGPGGVGVAFRFTSKQLKRLRAALRAHKKVVAEVFATALDSRHHQVGEIVRRTVGIKA